MIDLKNADFNDVNLKIDCKELLKNYHLKTKDHLGDLIYDVRNLIVHNYRKLNVEEIEILERINCEFEILLINVIEKLELSN